MKNLTPLQQALRQWLCSTLRRRGLKQIWLASASGLSDPVVNAMVQGRRPVSLISLHRIAIAFETKPSAILAEAEALMPVNA